MFDAVTAELPAGLPRGQVVARGVAIFDSNFDPLKPLTFAVVGGQRPTGGRADRLLSLGQTAVSVRSRSCCHRT
jgi:hypothetical protein